MPVRLEWWPVQALAPDGNETEEVLVPAAYIEHLMVYGPERKYLDSDSVPDVLRDPVSIFEGLNRAAFGEAYCYCGKPETRWNGQFNEPPPPDMVFVAYVNYSEDQEALAVFDWEWIPEDPDYPGRPKDWEQRYTRMTWPAI